MDELDKAQRHFYIALTAFFLVVIFELTGIADPLNRRIAHWIISRFAL